MTRILAMKPGHDGSIAYIEDGKLLFCLEAEKDSFPRYDSIHPTLVEQAMAMAPAPPDVVAVGGWHKQIAHWYTSVGSGYFGPDTFTIDSGSFCGQPVTRFSSTHERSHIYMATAMAPAALVEECVVLVWEGVFGAFYHWRDYGRSITRNHVMHAPGARYSGLYAIADEHHRDDDPQPRHEYAGKLMALAAYAQHGDINPAEKNCVDRLLANDRIEDFYPFRKAAYADTPVYNIGVHTPVLHQAARYLTDRIFDTFLEAAKTSMPGGLPLLISGGCGLNCEWNRRWRQCGHFSDVFVPPCTNDSGSAIGTAADAQTQLGGPCRIDWDVYAGADLIDDLGQDHPGWQRAHLDLPTVAELLENGEIVAWATGRCEIGPRALGHRSLLASPLLPEMKDRLNAIKRRENYRPIAPICRHEELDLWFDNACEDPYMLGFADVRTPALRAVTHVDGTARVQSVRATQEPVVHSLLTEFQRRTGYGVLCNTSLNHHGTGFINRRHDLLRYCEEKGIHHAIANNDHYRYTRSPRRPEQG
jgi:hydroxymethyl cephem carbamoyltransferase